MTPPEVGLQYNIASSPNADILDIGAAGDWTDDGSCSTTNNNVSYQAKEAPLTASPKAGTVPNPSLSAAIAAAQTAEVTRRNSRFFKF